MSIGHSPDLRIASAKCPYNSIYQNVVLDPKIPPANNAAERGLQEIVVHRKILGGIRAKEAMTWMANFFSCVVAATMIRSPGQKNCKFL